VFRDGDLHEVAVGDVVLDDVLDVGAGSEIVVDGEVLASRGLEVDESLLTGESDAVEKSPTDEVLSGSCVAAGAGRYRATKVGAEAYAVQLAEDARRFTLTRSELRSGIDTILTYVTWAIVPTTAFFVSRCERAMAGARRCGRVNAVAMLRASSSHVARVRRRCCLNQRKVLKELPAVEVLRIGVLCIGETGTHRRGSPCEVDPLEAKGRHRTVLAALAAADPSPSHDQRDHGASAPLGSRPRPWRSRPGSGPRRSRNRACGSSTPPT
jgi:cation-transporting ATPase E